jgi:hypothetical protein
MCSNGSCVAQVQCGGLNQPCCAGGTCTDPNDTCFNNTCQLNPQCGQLNQPCCTGNVCTGANLVCTNNTCVTPVVGTHATGDPCTQNSDCAPGVLMTQTPTCVKTTGMPPNALTWPMGYCVTPCRAASTANNGVNSDCPGGNATCSDGDHTCRSLCMTSTDCRAGYSCFVVNTIAPLGCEPSALSMCNPKTAGSCPMMNGMAQTCVNVGDGTVGECVPSCNPFMNTGCVKTDPNASDCHASDQTGEGLCTGAAPVGTGAGSACGNFYSDCPGGYGCLNGRCWKYCNDANKAVQCSVNATCQRFSVNSPVMTSVAGICSMSN